MILLVNRSQMGYGITLYLIFSALTDIRFKTEKLKKILDNSHWGKHSFSASKFWNEIPDSVRSSKTLNILKKKYDEIYGPKQT